LEPALEALMAVSSDEAAPPGNGGGPGGGPAAGVVDTPADASLLSLGDGGGDLATKPAGESMGAHDTWHDGSSESALVMVSTVLMSESMAEDMAQRPRTASAFLQQRAPRQSQQHSHSVNNKFPFECARFNNNNVEAMTPMDVRTSDALQPAPAVAKEGTVQSE
jgi:hypothetical protein